jgi:putative mRNA 3-end processing factor
MRLSFLGGADEVGKQSFLIEAGGATFLLDHGVKPGTRGELGSPPRPPPVDACLLTHSHLDHCGAIPQLMTHDSPPVVATEITREIALLLFDDAMRVAQREGRAPPYTHEAAHRTRRAFETVRPGDRFEHGGVEVTAHAAGHIPGALQFQVHAERELVLSGDINTEGTRLVNRAKVPECDVLVLEATYGGRYLPSRQAEEARLIRMIEETLDRGGACILPAFGIGRTQEVLIAITESTGLSPWVDGMAR